MARLKYYNDMTGEWEYADKAGADNDGAHYSMAVIASGTYTVSSDDETATDAEIAFMLDGATLEKIRRFKAVFVQISAESAINNSGTVRCILYKKEVATVKKVNVADFRYNLNTHRVMLIFADKEHYAGMVFANSSRSSRMGKTHASTEGADEKAGFGVVDMSTLSDDYVLSFEAYNCALGNELTYEVIGLAEETANFS